MTPPPGNETEPDDQKHDSRGHGDRQERHLTAIGREKKTEGEVFAQELKSPLLHRAVPRAIDRMEKLRCRDHDGEGLQLDRRMRAGKPRAKKIAPAERPHRQHQRRPEDMDPEKRPDEFDRSGCRQDGQDVSRTRETSTARTVDKGDQECRRQKAEERPRRVHPRSLADEQVKSMQG